MEAVCSVVSKCEKKKLRASMPLETPLIHHTVDRLLVYEPERNMSRRCPRRFDDLSFILPSFPNFICK
jgi:hypothetical protein